MNIKWDNLRKEKIVKQVLHLFVIIVALPAIFILWTWQGTGAANTANRESAEAGIQMDFKIRFTQNIYVKIFVGKEDSVTYDSRGHLHDLDGRQLGGFEVIALDDYDGVVKIQSSTPNVMDHVRYLSIPSLGLYRIRFEAENSERYFILDKGGNHGVKLGMKGELYEKDKKAGIFKVVGVKADTSYGYISYVVAHGNFRKAGGGKFQDYLSQVVGSTGFVNLSWKNIIMLLIGGIFIYLGIAKDYEPLLLVPIGFGILIGNIPLPLQVFNSVSVYMIDPVSQEYAFNTTSNSVMGLIYFGVKSGLLPPLIFLGIGAMTDFTAMLSNPKSVLLGAAAQAGIFITFLGALMMGFSPSNSAAIGIIGGADGPTAIFLSSRLAPSLIGPIAIAAYSYMAMVPIIQPPIMKLLTSKKERLIRMKPGRKVKKNERILFPIVGLILTTLVAPGAIPLLGMLFFGNLLKESGVTGRLAKTASNALIDIATILLGLAVGASTSAQVFLNRQSIMIFILGVISFAIATASGVLFAKLMNLFVKQKVNPLIGAAGVSAVPDSARVVHTVGKEEDPNNYLLMHAMGPNVAGVIGSAIAAGVFLGIF